MSGLMSQHTSDSRHLNFPPSCGITLDLFLLHPPSFILLEFLVSSRLDLKFEVKRPSAACQLARSVKPTLYINALDRPPYGRP